MCCIGLEDFSRTSVRSLFCQCFRQLCPPPCSRVARVTRGGLGATSAHVAFRARDRSASQRGPPTRPRDSWGPLRQLRPTAHSDSVIMGGLPLRLTVTHPGARTRTPTPKAQSQVARSLGAVRPGHSRGHLPFREGGR